MTTERCPTCKQPLNKAEPKVPMRKCYDCGDYIARDHRYTFQERDGVSVPVTVHRSCEYPEGYYNIAKCKRERIAPYSCYSKKEVEQIEQGVRDRCAVGVPWADVSVQGEERGRSLCVDQ